MSDSDKIYIEGDESGETEDQKNNGDELTLVPKRAVVSVVWKYFRFKTSDVDQKTFFCNYVAWKLLPVEEIPAICSTTWKENVLS